MTHPPCGMPLARRGEPHLAGTGRARVYAAAMDAGEGSDAPPGAIDVGDVGDGRANVRRGRVQWRLAWTLMLGFAGGLLLADAVGGIIVRIQSLLLVLMVSLFLSFAMEPAVLWLEQRGVRRGLGTLLVFVGAAILLAGFVAAMAQLIVDQVTNLVQSGPNLLENLAAQARNLPGELGQNLSRWLTEQQANLPDRLPGIAGALGKEALGVGTTLLGGLLQLLTTLLVTFYLVADAPRLRRVLVSRLEPARQAEFLGVWELAISKTGGYVYSRLLTAVASAVFHMVAFTIIGIPYPVALGVWVGIVSSLIPVIGTYLAGALPLLIALANRPIDALWVLVAVVIYQQVENYLIAPRITAATMSLHPAVAFMSVLIGGALLGPAGALLALPATAIVAALISAMGQRHEVVEHGLVAKAPPGGGPHAGPGAPHPHPPDA